MIPALQSWTVVRETWLSRKPSASAWFITAWSTVLVILSSVAYWKNYFNAQNWMPASAEMVFQKHELWRLWTTLFAHADSGHLVSNSLLFVVLGFFLTGYFGAWLFPVIAIFFGGITNMIVLNNYAPQVNLIGISGVVYWMGGAWLVLYFLIDQRKTITQRALRSLGVALSIFMPTSAFDPQISYQAHFVGFVLGVFSGAVFYWLHRQKFLNALVTEKVYEDDLSIHRDQNLNRSDSNPEYDA